MYCSNCGKQLPDSAKFCADCGQPIIIPENQTAKEPEQEKAPEPVAEPTPVVPRTPEKENEPLFAPEPEPVVPEENRPLSPWAYFGYGLLFSIPVVGFILLIVLSFAGKNVNRKNFTRSYWCWAILVLGLILIAVVVLLTGILRGLTNGIAAWLNSIGLTWLAGFFG